MQKCYPYFSTDEVYDISLDQYLIKPEKKPRKKKQEKVVSKPRTKTFIKLKRKNGSDI